MSAPLKNIEVDFNSGLGFFPVSIIIDFYEDESVSRDDLYNTINSIDGPKDIIFRENTTTNIETLSWVIPRLIAEGYFVSIYSDSLPHINYNRLITTITHPNQIKKNVKFLQALTDRDIIILNVDSVDHIMFSKKLLIQSQINSRVMFNSFTVLESYVIDAKIYDIIPIYEERIDAS